MNPAAPVTRTLISDDPPSLVLATDARPRRSGLRAARRLRPPVAVRVHALPAPGVAAHVVEPVRGLPPEQALRERGIRVRFGDVARAPADPLERYRALARALECLHRLEHRDAAPRAQVHREPAPFAPQRIERGKMPAREIDDMDVVAHAGAVARRIVA